MADIRSVLAKLDSIIQTLTPVNWGESMNPIEVLREVSYIATIKSMLHPHGCEEYELLDEIEKRVFSQGRLEVYLLVDDFSSLYGEATYKVCALRFDGVWTYLWVENTNHKTDASRGYMLGSSAYKDLCEYMFVTIGTVLANTVTPRAMKHSHDEVYDILGHISGDGNVFVV